MHPSRLQGGQVVGERGALQALDVELEEDAPRRGVSSLYVLGARRTKTRKGPIQREDSGERDGRGAGVCFVSSSTSSPTAKCTSPGRWEVSSAALRQSYRSESCNRGNCYRACTSAVTHSIRCSRDCQPRWTSLGRVQQRNSGSCGGAGRGRRGRVCSLSEG